MSVCEYCKTGNFGIVKKNFDERNVDGMLA